MQKTLKIKTHGRGLYLITDLIVEGLNLPEVGLLHCFLQHTSASLVIQENADPTAKKDLEHFMIRLVPDNDKWYTHTLEGLDDSSSHLKAAILPTFLTIPISGGRLGLGTWQGVYVWEHRIAAHTRSVLITVSP